MSHPRSPSARLLAALLLIAASSLAVHCAPVITNGGGPTGTGPTSAGAGGSTGGEVSAGTGGFPFGDTTAVSTSGAGGGTIESACLPLASGSIDIFSQADAQGAWGDPATGLAGNLFLRPATAGALHTDSSGTEVKYSQVQQVWGEYGGDPSFGVWFSGCVDASASSGITFEVWPLSAPAGSGAVLRVLTASTTPAPRGTCVPKSPETASTDCASPLFDPGAAVFGPQTPRTLTWSQLSGANPPESGAAAAKEILGLEWVVNAWVGPPAGPADIDVMVNGVAFTP